MALLRTLLVAVLVGLSGVLLTLGYEDLMVVSLPESDAFYNEIPETEDPEDSTTATPCASSELTKWDKLFSMLENSQMRETMLQHSTDDVLRAELRTQRDELLLRMDGLAEACAGHHLGSATELQVAQTLEHLRQAMDHQELQYKAVLQQILGAILDSRPYVLSNDVADSYGGQVMRVLSTVATDLQEVKAQVASAAQNSHPSGCEMALLFPLRSQRIFASVTPDISMSLRSFTVCLWAKATDTSNKTVLFSYGTRSNPEEIQLLLSGYATLFTVGGEAHLVEAWGAVTPGRWVHYCGTWSSEQGLASLWVDGQEAASSPGVAEGRTLPRGGSMLLGQEKNGCCAMPGFDDGFNARLAFAGKMTGVNVWDRVLGPDEIAQQARRDEACSTRGNVVGWGISEIVPHGGAQFIG